MRSALFFLVTLTCNLYGGQLRNEITEIYRSVASLQNSCTLTPSPSSVAALCCAQQPRTLRITDTSTWVCIAGEASMCCCSTYLVCALCFPGLPVDPLCIAAGIALPIGVMGHPDYPKRFPKEITCTLPACRKQRKPRKSPVIDI